MTTYTILSGKQIGTTIGPAQSITWGDLGSSPYGSWSNWTSWLVPDAVPTVQLQIDEDQGSIGYRTPLLNYGYEGDASVTLKISDTGTFTGEETTYNFVLETPISYVPGRYYRWTITVTTNSTVTEPYLDYYITNYISELETEILNDVDVFASPTTTLSTNLGFIRNIQATALQGDPYVVDDYVITAQDSTYTRTPKTISSTTPPVGSPIVVSTNQVKVGDYAFYCQNQNALYTDIGSEISGTDDFTFEAWIWVDSQNVNANIRNPIFYDGTGGDLQLNVRGAVSYNPDKWKLEHIVVIGGATETQVGAELDIDQWYHVALVRNGDTLKTYVDGVEYASDSVSGSLATLDTPLYIAGLDPIISGVSCFSGYLDEVRISNTARYTSAFTPNTAPHANDPDTVLLLHAEDFTDDGGVSYGTGAYFVTQQGGSPVIKQKNPPQVVVVDYAGSPWDGTIDAVLRGYPKIQLTLAGVEATSFRGDT